MNLEQQQKKVFGSLASFVYILLEWSSTFYDKLGRFKETNMAETQNSSRALGVLRRKSKVL